MAHAMPQATARTSRLRESGPARHTGLTRRPRRRTLQQSTSAYVWQGHRTDTKNSAYDGLNRDAAVAVLTSGYDKNGNLTNSGTHTYSYDAGNRLTLVGNGTTSMGVAWDPLGRLRATQTSAGVWTYFLYAGDQMVGEYALNTAGAPALRRYVHGLGVDEPLVWYEGAGVADRRWLHADRQGSIIGVSNGMGAVTPYTYGPWGEPSDWTGPRFRYTGQAAFPEAQAYHYKARVYDPAMGRFLQTDPMGQLDDLNLYAYVRGDPVNRNDPDGKLSYFVGRGIDGCLGICGHTFVVSHAKYPGDPSAKLYSWGPDGKRMGRLGPETETGRDDWGNWLRLGDNAYRGSATFRLINASDDAVADSASRTIGGAEYSLMPWRWWKILTNSNSGAAAAVQDADGNKRTVGPPDSRRTYPGIGEANRVKQMPKTQNTGTKVRSSASSSGCADYGATSIKCGSSVEFIE